tara:strand:+ start:542 stop:925 length:384 start_codon:yes stop_codon:yes gene_type:complete
MLSTTDARAIEQSIDVTWGKSSTVKSPSTAIRAKLFNADTLSVVYTTIVNFASEKSLRDQTVQLDEESSKTVKNYITELKKNFKKITGDTLKLKEVSSEPAIELISYNQFSPLRTAYYRNSFKFMLG